MWKYIKEEPKDDQYYKGENDDFGTFGSYSTFDSGKLYDIKTETDGESVLADGTNQYPWKTAPSYFPKLSIPLVRLEYSQNQEIIKYLKPLKEPAVTPFAKLQLEDGVTKVSIASRAH